MNSRKSLWRFNLGVPVSGYAAAAHSQIGCPTINQLHTDEQVSLLRGSGTPLYMDPEQRRGGAANPKHDLYSLGAVWYHRAGATASPPKPSGSTPAARARTRIITPVTEWRRWGRLGGRLRVAGLLF